MSAVPTSWPQPSIIIWVSPNGSDTGDGTYLHPYKTIEHALTVFNAGDQIRLMDGTYTPTDSLVFDGISGSIFAENPNEVIISPIMANIDSACISIKNTDRFSIIGLNVTQASSVANNIGIYIDNVTNLLIYSCNVYTFTVPSMHVGYGILASGKGRIERCYAYDIVGETIYGIKTTGIHVIDCEATALRGTTVFGIDSKS
jgi:hypothetical protein